MVLHRVISFFFCICFLRNILKKMKTFWNAVNFEIVNHSCQWSRRYVVDRLHHLLPKRLHSLVFHYLDMSVPDKGDSRSVSCALNLIYTYVLIYKITCWYKIQWSFMNSWISSVPLFLRRRNFFIFSHGPVLNKTSNATILVLRSKQNTS